MLLALRIFFIPVHYEKIIKYFIVYWKDVHSDYLDLLLRQTPVFKNNSTKGHDFYSSCLKIAKFDQRFFQAHCKK